MLSKLSSVKILRSYLYTAIFVIFSICPDLSTSFNLDNNYTLPLTSHIVFNNSAIEGVVWIDRNGDGIRNITETGIPGFPIDLIDNGGNVISSSLSDENGLYAFTDLPSGEYKVDFPLINSYFITKQNVSGGSNQETDTENDSDAHPATGESFEIDLEENQILQHVDAGYFQTGNIRGEIWEDTNEDGIKQNNEKKRAGFVVNLVREDNSPVFDVFGHIVEPVNSTSNGSFQFSNLIPDVYKIKWNVNYHCNFTKPNYSGKNADHNDIGNDSDAVNRTSHLIYMTSNRQVSGIDAGIKNVSTIICETFYDNNKNGIWDNNEQPGPSVPLEFWEVPGNHPCPADTAFFKTYFQTLFGPNSYILRDVQPGSYIIRIDSVYFQSGGILEGYRTSMPLEICVDVDCSKMSNNFDLGFYLDCENPGQWDQWSNCEMAEQQPSICNLLDLEGYCKTMLSETSPEPVPLPLCPWGGTPHNMSWFSFIAGYGNYEISINPFNCTFNNGPIGMQAGIYTDCSFTEAIYCQPECWTENITIPANSLIPGEKYYLFIDGCAGSVCDYEVEINGNYAPYHFPDSSALRLHAVQDTFCPNEMITFSLMGLQIKSDYTWSVKQADGNLPAITYPAGWPKTKTHEMILSFPTPGHYTVCMEKVSNTCEFRGPYCKKVVIQNKNKFGFIAKDTIVQSGDSITSFIELPNDTSSNVFIVPVQNDLIENMKNDTLYSGSGFLKQQLFNFSKVSQTASYLLYKDSIQLPDCINPDTLSITILPESAIYENTVRLCPDSCTTIAAMLPDSLTAWTHYLWNTGDTTRQIIICPDLDSVIHVFVRDTNDLFYKLQFSLIPEEISVTFDVSGQPACQDSVLELTFQAMLHNFPDENFRYFIFDCSQPTAELLHSSDTFGTLAMPLESGSDTLCFRLDIFSEHCSYSTYLSVSNPKSIIGEPCDDGDELTINDTYNEACECVGELINGTAENLIKDKFVIYPNPTSGFFTILSSSHEGNWEFFNAFGVKILPKIKYSKNSLEVDFSDYTPGLYILQCKNEKSKISFRIIKI